jgi:hypothetical protein
MKTKEKSVKELKEFGFVMALVLVAITGLLFWKHSPIGNITLAFVAYFIVSAIFCPKSLRKPEAVWMKLGTAIGVVVTHFILTAMFLVVITPLGVILRLFGKQFLELKPDPLAKTYWKVVSKEGTSTRYYLPY